jgi:dihydrodipicolinate synthase/N-acetylneuraminate lyase
MKVRQPDERVIELLNLMGDLPHVAVLKLMLSMHYRQTGWELVRPPQTRLSNEARDLMMKAFKTFNLLPTE